MFIITLLFPFVEFKSAIVAVHEHFDPFYYILEQFILPSPYDRSAYYDILYGMLRYVSVIIFLIEFGRFCCLAMFMVMIVTFTNISIIRILHAFMRLRWTQNCFLFYTKLHLINKQFEQVAQQICFILMFFISVACVIALWIVIKCVKLLPIMIYLLILFTGVAGVALTIPILYTGARVTVETRSLVRSGRIFCFTTHKFRTHRYYNYCRWRSQQCFGFKIGSLFLVDQDTPATYTFHLIDKLATAVLLINP